jgi:CHASE3 domain sensor protein
MNQSPTAHDPGQAHGARLAAPLPPGTLVAFIVAVLAIILVAYLSYRAVQGAEDSARRVTHSLEVTEQLQALLSTLQDAETGQRGFLLSGHEDYLIPYTNAKAALAGEFQAAHRLMVGSSAEQQRRLGALERVAADKMEELGESIVLRRSGDAAGALAMVRTNRGKEAMDRARSTMGDMQRDERGALAARQAEWLDAASISSVVVLGGSGLLLILVSGAAVRTSREYRARAIQAWIRVGRMGLSARIQGEQHLEALGNNVLAFLASYMHAQIGTVFVSEAGNQLRRIAAYAAPERTRSAVVKLGEGSLGQAAKENRVLHVTDVPAEYLDIASSLGRAKPLELVVAPASVDGIVHAVVEAGFFRRLLPEDLELLARVSESLGIAVRASKDRTRLEELLAETQRQGEELQTQQEELRVTNDELEVQAVALKESQAQLEAQQAELEQTNAQLEEQAQVLEQQKDELSRAQIVLVERATELQRANQYKSEFLANMSHELRTPLNSSLILAKILADNKGGNLTAEQIKYAQTISSAGNDLLAIINDILDLSKVEAGKVLQE